MPNEDRYKNNKNLFVKGHKGYWYGKKRTEEQKLKVSITMRGRPSPLKGRKLSEEQKRKISKAMKGMEVPWRKGLKMSEETKNKIRIGNKGKLVSEETRRKNSLRQIGIPKPYLLREKNPNWKGGVTPINNRIRDSAEAKIWKRKCMERDKFTCQKYKVKGCKLEVHHISNFSSHPRLRFSVKNGVTLSKEAHKEFHKRYGKKNNSKEQLIEFLKLN